VLVAEPAASGSILPSTSACEVQSAVPLEVQSADRDLVDSDTPRDSEVGVALGPVQITDAPVEGTGNGLLHTQGATPLHHTLTCPKGVCSLRIKMILNDIE
jgi:hypothetical protein